ncbi:MAG: hypothetical protein H8E10_02870 [Desulfobacterales bacterium]|nr:hypothetical protein [Desulfobacterales bacterium]
MPCGFPIICLSVMPESPETPAPSDASPGASLSAALNAIAAEFEVAMGSAERVKAACTQLRRQLTSPPSSSDLERLRQLLPLLSTRMGPIATLLFDLFDTLSLSTEDLWPFLKGMLGARDRTLALRALERLRDLAESGAISVNLQITGFLASRVEMDGSPLVAADCLEMVAKIIQHLTLPGRPAGQDPLIALYLQEKDRRQRLMAARILDSKGNPAPSSLAEAVLGRDVCQFLSPYLAFTRATHLDLIHLVPVPGVPPPVLPSLQRAEALCGNRLLRELIAELGWERLNFGLHVRKQISISIGKSFPFMVSPAEATLFESVKEARPSGEHWIFIAYGGLGSEDREGVKDDNPVSLFREYNLAHADVLAEILSLAPLTRETIRRILDLMGRIVSIFTALFSSHSDDCAALSDKYRGLRERITLELEKAPQDNQLSPELTRLVQMFEDPASLDEVQTLHGLKRYLHQRGLDLVFCLVETRRATNRTVSISTASPVRILRVFREIRYVDFEPEQRADESTSLPYPVSALVEGFARQILHGQAVLPDVRIFCYGNEVHYYFSFQNHPAFLRIDYSPPLKGGMIDLKYYGVSKNELDLHPNPSLDAIQQVLRKIEFDVQAKDTRIHARYDKEKTLDLADLCKKVEALFRLIPYLMEIDWVIGSLDLPDESRQAVADAWTAFFARWGVLPINQLLTKDRQAILVKVEKGLKGDREVAWTGQAPYCDRFSTPVPADLSVRLQSALAGLGLKTAPSCGDLRPPSMGQLQLENLFLGPLREAVTRGEITEKDNGFQRTPGDLFKRVHEAERFAEIVTSEKEAVAASASLARLLAPLEQTLPFQTTGRLNGCEVQSASLPILGRTLTLFVVRDLEGMICLAMFAPDKVLCCRRETGAIKWCFNGSLDASVLAMVLWLNRYTSPGMGSMVSVDMEGAERIGDLFRRVNLHQLPRPFHDEKALKGLKASPGRAVGRVLLGTEGRRPKDFEGSILVTPSLRPEDNTFLYHSSGIISTGGGILSHAGLTAIQFRKPALIISGEWQRSPDGALMLMCRTSRYREEKKTAHGCHISIHSDVHERDHSLREGDLVVIDADEGSLQVLGQGRDALAFHEDFQHLGEATRQLTRTTDKKKTLILRGRRLRSRHQIEKLLGRFTDPMLACHVVRELVVSDHLSSDRGGQSEKTHLLSTLLKNPDVGSIARDHLLWLFDDLKRRNHALMETLLRQIPSAEQPYEILWLRLKMRHLRQTLEGVFATLRGCGFETVSIDDLRPKDVDPVAEQRLRALREIIVRDMAAAASSFQVDFRLRHLVRQANRLDLVLETQPDLQEPIARIERRIVREDRKTRDRLERRRILTPQDGGFELFPFIGWKAANLAEVERLGGRGLTPPWIVIADRAFQEILDAVPDRNVDVLKGTAPDTTLRQAIESILRRDDVDDFQKSINIRQLWEGMTLPAAFVQEVVTAYHHLNENMPKDSAEEDPLNPFVAIRSSSKEEDAEMAARAGEFDTFLFIRRETALLDHIKRAWSGLWTERAIHNRLVLGMTSEPAGGVIVQRNVWSRVSGVLQTVNVAEGNLREMVINAALGLGEGVVSGIVSADQIVVDKEGIRGGGPLRFRYITRDKNEQVVFDKHTGLGTVLSHTLSHQRLRPALEYVELCELVRIADRLETAYGYPLDIEFGIEGAKLWILQARPVVPFLAALQETVQNYPLAVRKDRAPASTAKEIPL